MSTVTRLGRYWLPWLAAALAVLTHASAFGRFFLKDEVVALRHVSLWSWFDVLSRATRLVAGELDARAHVLGYLHVKLAWTLFGDYYPGHALLAVFLHAFATWLTARLYLALCRRDPRVAIVAASLFAIWGATVDIGDFATVQHTYLAIGSATLALAYLSYGRRPSAGRVAFVIASAILCVVALEIGPVAALIPALLELTLRLTPEWPDVAPLRGAPRARALLCLASAGTGLPRLLHEAPLGVLLGKVPLEPAAPERYTMSHSPSSVLIHLTDLFAQMVSIPTPALALLAALVAFGVWNRATRRTAIFGAALGMLLALPLCLLKAGPPAFYGYAPALGMSGAYAAGAIALLGVVRAGRGGAWIAAVGTALSLLLIYYWHAIRQNDAARAPAFAAQRAIVRDLAAAFPPGVIPAPIVLHGLPTGVIHADHPLMVQHGLPLFLPDRRFQAVWVISQSAVTELAIDGVRFVAQPPRGLPHGARAFRFDGARLIDCQDVACSQGPN